MEGARVPKSENQGAIRVSRWARIGNSGWPVPRSPRSPLELRVHPSRGGQALGTAFWESQCPNT